MWNRIPYELPDEEVPVIIAYIGATNDLEFAVAEYISEELESPVWRIYIDSDKVSCTVDIDPKDVLLWTELYFPPLNSEDVQYLDLRGRNINAILEER